MMRFRHKVLSVAAVLALGTSLMPPATFARTQVGNICTVYGQKEMPIIGIGLVVGLNRTGDGSKKRARDACAGLDVALFEQSDRKCEGPFRRDQCGDGGDFRDDSQGRCEPRPEVGLLCHLDVRRQKPQRRALFDFAGARAQCSRHGRCGTGFRPCDH